MKTLQVTPLLESLRAAYYASQHYRKLHGLETLPAGLEPGEDREESNVVGQAQVNADEQATGASRQVGYKPAPTTLALGIELDSLEQEFMDMAQP